MVHHWLTYGGIAAVGVGGCIIGAPGIAKPGGGGGGYPCDGLNMGTPPGGGGGGGCMPAGIPIGDITGTWPWGCIGDCIGIGVNPGGGGGAAASAPAN